MTEGRIVTRRQNPQSVMVWAVVTATRRSPLLFVPTGMKLNSEWYVSDILEGFLLPWAKQHFKNELSTLQQDSAPSHGSKFTQLWILRKISSFINKEGWPVQSLDLNPLDYSIWSILEKRVCSTPHQTLESLKAKLMIRVGRYTSRNTTCHVRLVFRQIEGCSQEQRELY